MSEIADSLETIRAMLAAIEEQSDPGAIEALNAAGAALASYFEAPRSSKKPARGVGYTLEEAQIAWRARTCGLPEAVREHWAGSTPEWIDAVVRRIRKRQAELTTLGEEPDF